MQAKFHNWKQMKMVVSQNPMQFSRKIVTEYFLQFCFSTMNIIK